MHLSTAAIFAKLKVQAFQLTRQSNYFCNRFGCFGNNVIAFTSKVNMLNRSSFVFAWPFRNRFEFGRGSRERRTPLSEIATDTPPIWQRDTGQPRRCAMVRPRHEGTPYVIEVTLRPGKYELLAAKIKIHTCPRDRSLWLFDFEKSTAERAPGRKQGAFCAESIIFVKI